MRKFCVWILAALVLFSVAACGGPAAEPPVVSGGEAPPAPSPQETEQVPEAPVLVAGADLHQDDKGAGPVLLSSRYGSIYIPEGLDYEIRYMPETVEIGKYDSFQVGLSHSGDHLGGVIEVYSRRVASLEDCVQLCIDTNNYGGAREAKVSEETLVIGGLEFKEITLQKPDGSSKTTFLVAYYENGEGTGGCIEVWDYEHGWGGPLRVHDPLVAEMLGKSTFK